MVTGHALTLNTPAFRTAYQAASQVIRSHSRTFYWATALLPLPARLAIRSLYAFCRATDDLVDQRDASLADVDRWRQQVAQPANEQTDPVLVAWVLIREQYQIDRRYEQELIDGVQADLTKHRYQTWAELEQYCYLVASTVGLLSIPIIGLAPEATLEQAAPLAIRLGQALQLTNILRDVGEDAQNGRVYLPLDELKQFDLTAEEILAGVHDERFVALMQFQIARARRLYQEAWPGVAMLNASARPAVGAAALLYRAILDEIEGIQYQVHEQRAHTTGWKKLALLPDILRAIHKPVLA